VRWDKTPRKVVKAAVQTLKTSGISIVGSVLQQVNLGRYGRLGYGSSGYYYHYGRYGRYYQE
jgi:Mrp family chromosome partitioning ATPase